MPLPTRPVSGASIESVWGQDIHDWTFAPAGVECHGAAVNVSTAGVSIIPLDTADSDPGGWLDAANDRLVVPTDRDGIYDFMCRLDITDGDDGDGVRGYIRRNGGEIARGFEDVLTGEQVILTMVTKATLTAGDIITIHGKKKGNVGSNPDVLVSRLILLRVGSEFGA